MKYIFSLVSLVLLNSCYDFFDSEMKEMGRFNYPNGNVVKAIDGNLGATSSAVIWITKIDGKGKEITIDSFEQLGSFYSVSFMPINDTLLNVILTDTVLFFGKKIIKEVNLNTRIR